MAVEGWHVLECAGGVVQIALKVWRRILNCMMGNKILCMYIFASIFICLYYLYKCVILYCCVFAALTFALSGFCHNHVNFPLRD